MVDEREKYKSRQNESGQDEEENGEDFVDNKAGFQGRSEKLKQEKQKSKEKDKKIKSEKPKPTPVIIGEDIEAEKEQPASQEKANMNDLINLYDELVKLGVYDKDAIIGVMTEDDEFAEYNTTKQEFLKFLEKKETGRKEFTKELAQHLDKEFPAKEEKPEIKIQEKGAFQIGQEVIGKNKDGIREEGWKVAGRVKNSNGEIGSYVLEKGEKGKKIRIHVAPDELVELNWPKKTETAPTVEEEKEDSKITKPVLPKMSKEEAVQAKKENKQEVTSERVKEFVDEFDVKQKTEEEKPQIELALTTYKEMKSEESHEDLLYLLKDDLTEAGMSVEEFTELLKERGIIEEEESEEILTHKEIETTLNDAVEDVEEEQETTPPEKTETETEEEISEKNKLGLKIFKKEGPLTREKFARLYSVEKEEDTKKAKEEGEDVFTYLQTNKLIKWDEETIKWDKSIKQKEEAGTVDKNSPTDKLVEKFILSSEGEAIEIGSAVKQKTTETWIELALNAYEKAESKYSHQERLDLAMKLLKDTGISEEEFIELLKERGIIKEEESVEAEEEKIEKMEPIKIQHELALGIKSKIEKLKNRRRKASEGDVSLPESKIEDDLLDEIFKFTDDVFNTEDLATKGDDEINKIVSKLKEYDSLLDIELAPSDHLFESHLFSERLKETIEQKDKEEVKEKPIEEEGEVKLKKKTEKLENAEKDEKNRFRVGEALFETGDYVKVKRSSGDIENDFVIKKIIYNPQPVTDKTSLTVQSVEVENKEVKKIILINDLLKLNPSGSVAEAEFVESTEKPAESIEEEQKEIEIPDEIHEASVEGGLEKFNISLEDMKKVEGFDELSEGQQFLVLENLKQITLGRTQDASRAGYHKDLSNVGIFSRIWKGITKQYQIAKKEKEELAEIKAGGIEMHKDVLQQLVNGMKNFNTEVEVNEKSELEIQYASGLENVHESVIKKFNKIATEFSKIPHEWSYESTASNKDIEKWNKVKEDYEKARGELMENMLYDKKAEEKIFEIDRNVQFNQFLNTNPEVEKELQNISDKGLWRKTLKDTLTERGIYTGAGFITRTVTVSLLGAIAVPAVAGLIGGLIARKRGKESLIEREKLGRKGTKDKSKETYDLVDAESLTKKLEYTISDFNKYSSLNKGKQDDKNREKIKKILAFLKERINYTSEKIDSGLVNFGEENKRIVNHYELMQKLAKADSVVNSADDIDIENDKLVKQLGRLPERLENRLNKKYSKVAKEKKTYLLKQMGKGVTLGATFATLGWLIRGYVWGGDEVVSDSKVSKIEESTPTPPETSAPETPLSMLEDKFTGERNLDKKVVAGKQLIDRYEQRGDHDLADALKDEVEELEKQIENQKLSEPTTPEPEPEPETTPETSQETFTIKNREWIKGENEQMLKWGGVERTGINKDGDFVLDIKDMLEEENVKGLVEEGKEVKILFSTGENQQEVISLNVDDNGKLIIPQESNLFTAENGKAVFHGKNMEVAIVDKEIDGPENVKILATVQGDSSVDSVKDVTEVGSEKNTPPSPPLARGGIETQSIAEESIGSGEVAEPESGSDTPEAVEKAEELNQKVTDVNESKVDATPEVGTTGTEVKPQEQALVVEKQAGTPDEQSRLNTLKAHGIPENRLDKFNSLAEKTGIPPMELADNFKIVDRGYFDESMQVALLNIFSDKGDASEILGSIDKDLGIIKSVSITESNEIIFKYNDSSKVRILGDKAILFSSDGSKIGELKLENISSEDMKNNLKDPEGYFGKGEGAEKLFNYNTLTETEQSALRDLFDNDINNNKAALQALVGDDKGYDVEKIENDKIKISYKQGTIESNAILTPKQIQFKNENNDIKLNIKDMRRGELIKILQNNMESSVNI